MLTWPSGCGLKADLDRIKENQVQILSLNRSKEYSACYLMILVRLEDTQACVVVASVTNGGICVFLKSPWTVNSEAVCNVLFCLESKTNKIQLLFCTVKIFSLRIFIENWS